MIYPTRAGIVAAAVGAPVALLVATVLPHVWYAGLAWPLAVLALSAVDALTGPPPGAASARVGLPRSASVGATIDVAIGIDFAGTSPGAVEVAFATDALIAPQDDARIRIEIAGGTGSAVAPVVAARRGVTRIDALWLRWKGSLGLVWKQRHIAFDASTRILPDVRPVHERGAQVFQRHALQGLIAQVDRGDGADFDSLVEFRPGMDRRAIDWKQSARHLGLRAKEYRSECNNQIVFAIDAGRQMSEPVAGLPRIDRAVAAMLLAAWVALKLGDRVALHAFDSRPRIASRSASTSGEAVISTMARLA